MSVFGFLDKVLGIFGTWLKDHFSLSRKARRIEKELEELARDEKVLFSLPDSELNRRRIARIRVRRAELFQQQTDLAARS